MTNNMRKGILFSFITMILWALIDVGFRFSAVSYEVKPFIFVCLTFFISALALIGFAGAGRKGLSTLKRGHTWFYGFVNILMNLAEIFALIYITSTEMNFLNRITVLIAVFATWMIFSRKPYKSDVLGGVLVLAGLSFIAYNLDPSVRAIALSCIAVSAVLSTASAMVGEAHKDNLEAVTIKDQARVSGYVLFACSCLFLFTSISLGFLKGFMPADLIQSQSVLQSLPSLEDFNHKPTFYAAIIFGLSVMPLSMYYFFVATKTAKTETFMIVSSTLPFLTLTFEWIASLFGLLDISAVTYGDIIAGLVVVFGAFMIQYLRHKRDLKGNPEDLRKDNTIDDYEMVESAIRFCEGDLLECAKKLEVDINELEDVHAGEGEVAFKASDDKYKRIMRNYHRRIAKADKLTGLANEDALMSAIEGATRKREAFALAFLDMNKFKPINDTYGHAIGDAVLKEFAKRVKETLPTNFVVSRPHGDEFIIMMRHTCEMEAKSIMTELMTVIDVPFKFDEIDDELHVGASFGVVDNSEVKDPQKLIDMADKAMYANKRGDGR